MHFIRSGKVTVARVETMFNASVANISFLEVCSAVADTGATEPQVELAIDILVSQGLAARTPVLQGGGTWDSIGEITQVDEQVHVTVLGVRFLAACEPPPPRPQAT